MVLNYKCNSSNYNLNLKLLKILIKSQKLILYCKKKIFFNNFVVNSN